MPGANDVAIANRALRKLGHQTITAFADSTPEARLANDTYDEIRDAFLQEHPWNFAIRRETLSWSGTGTADPVTITGITNANPGVVTAAAHGYSNGDFVILTDVVGMTEVNGNTYRTGSVAANTFALLDADLANINTTGFTAYASAGKTHRKPDFDFTYVYDLPSDCLRLLEIDNGSNADWRLENKKILTDLDSSEIKIRYIAQVTTPSQWNIGFTNAFVYRLALEWSEALTARSSVIQKMQGLYFQAVRVAKAVDGQEDRQRVIAPPATGWLGNR